MADIDDPFGTLLQAEYGEGGSYEIVERDDGHVDATPASFYFRSHDEWSSLEQEAVELVEGRVLDIGCGAGRHCLYLQQQGVDVVGLDVSPGALAVAEARGVERTLERDVGELGGYDGEPFDTVCMFGNNFGLVGTRDRAPTILEAIDAVTTPSARILAASTEPYGTDDPFHLAYHQRNEDRGRLAGALRLRIRYRLARSDWFDYLLAAPEEMRSIAHENGWMLDRVIQGDDGPSYVGVLETPIDR